MLSSHYNGEYTHLETRMNITCNNKQLYELLSVEKNIDKDYPPTFVWTTKQDNVVSFYNSVMLVEQLGKNKISNEFILFPFLDHGKSIGTDLVNEISNSEIKQHNEIATWVDKSIDFIEKNV